MLLTSYELNRIQLRSRRPVLLEVAAIDGFPYALSSAPLLNAILKDIYKGDLLKVPASPEEPFIKESEIPNDWNQRTPALWKSLAKKYGFSQILTTPDYHLQLPIVLKSNDYVLYQV